MAQSEPDTDSSPQSRRTFLKFTGAGAAAAIAGCLGGDDGEPTPTPGENGDPNGDPDDEFVFLSSHAMDSPLDPALHNGSTEMMAFFNFYDTLIWFDEDNQPIANLATDWWAEDDGATFVFELRDGVKTHDGNEIDAEDLEYSLERYINIGLGLSGHFTGVYESSEARDDGTFAISTEFPFPPFFNAFILVHAVDSTVVREHEEPGDFGDRGDWGQAYLAENVAGSGPYKLDVWRREEELVYEWFEDYWGGWESNQFSTIRQLVIPEDSTQQIMMESSDADMSSDLLAPQIYDQLDQLDHINFVLEPLLVVNYHITNTTKPPLDDVNFRKAVAHSIDYDVLRENIYGFMLPNAGCIPDELPGSNDELEPYALDEEVALQAFEDCEYTAEEINDMEMECHFFAGSETGSNSALQLQSALDDLFGIDISIQETSLPDLVALFSDPDTNPHFTTGLAFTADYPDHDQFLHFMWHPDSTTDKTGHPAGANYFTDPELTDLIEQSRRELDEQARYDLYAEAEAIVYHNYASMFLGSNPATYALNTSVGGFSYTGAQGTERRIYDMYRIGDGRD